MADGNHPGSRLEMGPGGKPSDERENRKTNCTKEAMPLCHSVGKTPKVATSLKTKGRKEGFSPPRVARLIKRNPLTINHRKQKLAGKWSDSESDKLSLIGDR